MKDSPTGDFSLEQLAFEWCVDSSRAAALGELFATNAAPEYISHQELQWGRAVRQDRWMDDLAGRIRGEIERAIDSAPHGSFFSALDDASRKAEFADCFRRVAVAQCGDVEVGLAIVLFEAEGQPPFAVLEDFLMASDFRGKGIGRHFLKWLQAEIRAVGVRRVFLESGRSNDGAHEFFHGEGFAECSVVMYKELD